MASLSPSPKLAFWDNSGNPLTGGLLFTYQAGTTTKQTTYTDQSQNTANTNPIVLDSRGEANVWLPAGKSFKFVLSPSTDTDPPTNPIWTVDNIFNISQLTTTTTKTGNYTVVPADANKLIKVDATTGNITITLLSASEAADGFTITIKKIDSSTNSVTIDANSTETIDASLTWVLNLQNESVTLISDGTNWQIKERVRQLRDNNGNEVLKTGTTASAVNEVTITNAATGNNPTISVTGDDTNIGMNHSTKGTGGYQFNQGSNEILTLSGVTSAVNEINISSAATGNSPTVSSTGTDANIGITHTTKGTGVHTDTYEDSRTNTAVNASVIQATTSGTPAAGIGVGQLFRAESADEAPSDFGAIQFSASDVGAGSEDTYESVFLRVAGNALAERFRRTSTSTAGKLIETHAVTADRTVSWPDTSLSRFFVQMQKSISGATATGTTLMVLDDTIPQITEGDEYYTVSITPSSSSSRLIIVAFAHVAHSVGGTWMVGGLFQDATSNALAAAVHYNQTTADVVRPLILYHEMQAGTTSSTTFRFRIGGVNAGTLYVNGTSGGRLFGGVLNSGIIVTEVTA